VFHVKHPLTPDAFRALTGIDAATLERLGAHLRLLEKWQPRINLVGRGSLDDPWRRHILDSAQLVPLVPEQASVIVDIGSGAGFPGLVIAIIADRPVHLVDSDARKCAFLREAARLTQTPVSVHNQRIERLEGLKADVVTARACAPLPELLGYAAPLLRPGGRCLFLKGKTAAAELTASEKTWMMRATRLPSRSDPSGTILMVDDLHPRTSRVDDSQSR
jgi:16S rRNA (guanine(527)-N(7))-methyltransferase RsmG